MKTVKVYLVVIEDRLGQRVTGIERKLKDAREWARRFNGLCNPNPVGRAYVVTGTVTLPKPDNGFIAHCRRTVARWVRRAAAMKKEAA